MVAKKTPAYDPSQPPRSKHNRLVAKLSRWKFDRDWRAYRDRFGFVLDADPQPQPNCVDSMR